eukprot:225033-Rhodomonas_salina.1
MYGANLLAHVACAVQCEIKHISSSLYLISHGTNLLMRAGTSGPRAAVHQRQLSLQRQPRLQSGGRPGPDSPTAKSNPFSCKTRTLLRRYVRHGTERACAAVQAWSVLQY